MNGKIISKYEDTIQGVFDEQNIVLSFPVFSDIHLSGNDEHEGYFRSHMRFVRAIKYSAQYAVRKHLDLVCVAGDLGTCTNAPSIVPFGTQRCPGTLEEQYKIQARRERENLLRGLLDAKPYYEQFFYCLGNHDGGGREKTTSCINYLSGKNYEYFDWFYGGDLDKENLYIGNRHIKVKGYHFLALTPTPEESDFAWLKVRLDEILAENPAQTIFLLHHFRPRSMTFLSDERGDEIRNLLEDYPQVIVFGGHTHTYIDFDNALMQSENGFISVDAGSVRYLRADWVVSKDKKSAPNIKYRDVIINSTGLLVEVDKNGNVRIGRYNYLINAKIGSSWVIPAVKSNGTRELLYTKERSGNSQTPAFLSEKIKATLEGNILDITFPAAYTNQKIYHYEIKLKEDKKEKTLYASSLFYKYATPEDMPKEYSVSYELDEPFTSNFALEITAVDSWGNRSKPILFNSK